MTNAVSIYDMAAVPHSFNVNFNKCLWSWHNRHEANHMILTLSKSAQPHDSDSQ